MIIARILTHLGDATDGPVPSRAWDPLPWDAWPTLDG